MSWQERAAKAYCTSIGLDPYAQAWGYTLSGAWLWLPRWAWYMSERIKS